MVVIVSQRLNEFISEYVAPTPPTPTIPLSRLIQSTFDWSKEGEGSNVA